MLMMFWPKLNKWLALNKKRTKEISASLPLKVEVLISNYNSLNRIPLNNPC